MSIEYKDRGALHKLTSKTKFKPQQSKKALVRWTAKTALAAETAVIFTKDLAINRFVGKETHLKFERNQQSDGTYKQSVKFVRTNRTEQPRGIFHQAFTLDRYIEGDKPFHNLHPVNFRPQESESNLVRRTAKAILTAESTLYVAKDLAVNRFVGKEEHIRFERNQQSDGTYKTKVKIVRTDRTEQPRGLIHKAFTLDRFIEGDKPSINLRPQQSQNVLIRGLAKTALTTESTLLKAKDTVTFVKNLAVNRFVGKETHIKFERKQQSDGTYKTHIKFVRREATERPSGVFHKLYALGRFVEGDKPFQKKPSVKFKPKTIKGELTYGAYLSSRFIVRNSTKLVKSTVKATLLTGETALKKASSAGTRLLIDKLRYNTEMSDSGKSVMAGVTAVQTLNRGRKYLINYRRNRALYRQKKISFKGKQQQAEASKIKYRAAKENYQLKKNEIKQQQKNPKEKFKSAKKTFKEDKAELKKKKIKYKSQKRVFKSKRKYQKQLKKSEKSLHKNIKKQRKLAKKEMKKAKPLPLAALPLVPATSAAKQLSLKYARKAIETDPNNDFAQAAKAAERAARIAGRGAVSAKKLYQKVSGNPQNRLRKEQNRLSQKNADLKKNKRKHIKKNQKTAKQKAGEKAKEAAKKLAEQAKKALGNFVRFAVRFLGILLVPIISLLLVFLIILMIFTGSAGNSSYILGTYNAEDRYISSAIEHYTKIAYDLNQNVMKCNSSDWKSALRNLGVQQSSLSTYDNNPNRWKFGRSQYLNYDVGYDFDPDMLAAFMCAYYYQKDSNGNVQNWVWNDSYKDTLKKLFNEEYEFKHYYLDYSGWKTLTNFSFYGGGGASGTYYTVKDNISRSEMTPISVPNEIWQFVNNGKLHYNYNTLEVLNANDGDKQTGYFIQDQRYYYTDSRGHYRNPFYTKINNIKWAWANGYNDNGSIHYEDRSSWYWVDTNQQIYCVVNPTDTAKWFNTTTKDKCLISFYRKNEWVDNCTLYYTVRKKCTFEQAIKNVIRSKNDNTPARLEFYNTIRQQYAGGTQTYGNHQMFNAPVLGKSLQRIINNNKIYNGFGYDMQEWNKTHCSGLTDNHKGMDILANRGENVYAMFDGKIDKVDTSKSTIHLKTTSDIKFWYCGNDTHPVEIIYCNVSANVSVGTTVRQGQIIGKINSKKRCFDNRDIHSSKNYLHITVKIDYGWGQNIEVDPRFLIYRTDSEAR